MGFASKYGKTAVGSTPAKTEKMVVDYEADVRQSSTGKWGFVIEPVYSDGSRGGFRENIWIPLNTPDKLRALRKALPRVAKQMDEVDADLVADAEQTAWFPRPGAEAAQSQAAKAPDTRPTTPRRSVPVKVTSAVIAPSNGQVKPPASDMDAALADMPF